MQKILSFVLTKSFCVLELKQKKLTNMYNMYLIKREAVMKKFLAVISMTMMLVAAMFTGCSGGSAGVLQEGEHATLRLMAGGTQWQGTYLENLRDFVDAFNDGELGEAAQALNVTIELDVVTDMSSTYPTRLRSESRYPHLMLFDRFNTPEYVENDFILDLNDYFGEREIDTSLFTSAAMTEMVYDGVTYGLPVDLDLWGIYVNMDMVEAYNSDPNNADDIVLSNDWTWTEFLEIAKKLTSGSGDEMVGGYYVGDIYEHFYKFFLTTGEDFLKADNTPNMDTGAARAVLEFFKELTGAGISRNVEDIGFPREQIAMYTEATYYASYIERMNSDLSYKFMPMPKAERSGYDFENASSGGMFGGFGLVIPKPIERIRNDAYYSYVERSLDVLEWWTVGEGASYWSQYNDTMPALESLQDDEELMDVQTLKDASAFVDRYQIRPQLPGYMNYQIYTINSNVGAYLADLSGGISIEKTISGLKDTTYLLGLG